MNSVMFLSLFFAAAVLAPQVNGQIGRVGSLTRLELYNKASGPEMLAKVDVDENITLDEVKEFLTHFDAKKETKILIHGWMDNDKKPFAQSLIKSYVPAFDYNVIFVDWYPESKQFYPRAVQAVPPVGYIVADLIDFLVQDYAASLDKIHIIGHSLGAHIAGIAGLNVQSGQVARITGLDPAKPWFHLSTKERLRPESAKFVDVIHTCSNYLSFSEAIGHVDFYPNGGKAIQPGCGFRDMIGGKCSHGRSYEYFAESVVSPQNFLARFCHTWNLYVDEQCTKNPTAYMGEGVPTNTRGTYYLRTNKKQPYGMGNES